MLIRLDPADSVPAGQRVVRAERCTSALQLGSGPEATSTGARSYRALPGAVRCYTTESDVDETSSGECQAGAAATFAAPFRAQHICEAYRATDPVQPRPGLYLHVRA